jgi:hypothetical protein
MNDNEFPTKTLWTNPEGKRGLGGQKSRWIVGVEKEARKMVCGNWLADAQDRGSWRHLHEESKAHPGLYSR